jgi:cobyrinic acid a,c-diamide synthase
MLPPAALERAFARAGDGVDLVLVEGVMGLFDGLDGQSETASTAEVAKRLGLPVVLVVDASAQARTAAALVLGAERFDPDLALAAVIFNRIGGDRHAQWLREAVAGHCRARPVGALPWRPALGLPERHLGLVTARERRFPPGLFDSLASLAEASVDLEACLALARSVVDAAAAPSAVPPQMRLAVAVDDAFQFYYPDNLDALRAAGAEIVTWSPLADRRLPAVDALYLGGGYPELHVSRLAENAAGRAALRAFVLDGGPVYAECGGLMYLAETLDDPEGRSHPMAGVFPLHVRMQPPRLTLGYREVALETDCLLGPAGARLRGHEFHASHLADPGEGIERAFRVEAPGSPPGWRDGYRVANALASYVHLHFASRPGTAEAFVASCLRACERPVL